jgi:DNA-binding response OmpR family regulator
VDRFSESVTPQKRKVDQKTILIVEDEELMLRLVEKFFSRHGYRVITAADGEQALDIYHSRQQEIDAVLLDMRLPRITGEEVFRRMTSENAAAKIVMASGFLDPQLRAEMARAGVKYLVDKPYVLSELLEIFDELIAEQ